MDIFQVILLFFELALLAAILVLPYLLISKVVRMMISSVKKTYHTIFN